jgi:mRNA interferase MazF
MATRTKAQRQENNLDFPRRGDIYLVNFDPTAGAEIQKTQPALVLQNDIANRYSAITIVVAITSKFDLPPYPTEVAMQPNESGLPQASSALLNQIRSVDRKRLIKRIGKADAETMRRVEKALKISLGLIQIQ